MADSKITALAALTAADPVNDMFPVVDVSDTSMAASGTTKRISVNNILSSSPTASGALTVTGLVTAGSATITGDLTVDTNVLKVDSTNNRVGIGTATPSVTLDVAGITQVPSGSAGGVYQWAYGASASSRSWRAWSDVSANGDFQISTSTTRTGSTYSDRYRIDVTGVHEWSNTSGTAMTLNSTGLGVGGVPSGVNRFSVFNGATQALTLDTSGNLLVGTTNTDPTLNRVNGVVVRGNSGILMRTPSGFSEFGLSVTSGVHFYFTSDNGTTRVYGGNISTNGSTTAYNTTSDYRLKESVQPLVGGLDRINALKPSIYKWKTDGSNGEGFLAHELAEIVPIAVTGEKDAVKKDGSIDAQGVDMSKVIPILVAAIQELTARVQTLEAR